jgi:hypothetical protein
MSINTNYQCTVLVRGGIRGASPHKFLNEKQKGRVIPPFRFNSDSWTANIRIGSSIKEFAGAYPANSYRL